MGRRKTVWRQPRIGAVWTGQGGLTPSRAQGSGLPPALTASFSPVRFLMEAFVLVGYLLFNRVSKVWGKVSPSGHC